MLPSLSQSSTITFQFSREPLAPSIIDAYVVPAEGLHELFPPFGNKKPVWPVFCYGNKVFLKAAFASGCTDFIKDPWEPEELIVRVESFFRRRQESLSTRIVYLEGELIIRGNSGLKLPISFPEYRILALLLNQKGRIIPRTIFAYALWDEEKTGSRAIDVHISSLRRKLRFLLNLPDSTRVIKCFRGKGYMLSLES